MKKIMLIDGNSIINRAFYGLPMLTNSDGTHTNGIYGFLNIFFKLYEEENPTNIGVAFDLKGPTFRHNKYQEYKARRKTMPQELRSQIPMLKEILTTMGIQIFEEEGYEADDILGTLSVNCSKQGMDVVLISGDRDLLQLATKTVKIRIPKTKGGKTEIEDYYEKDVIEKIGVTPKQYIDVKALMGDTSDNIPGVPSIGEKTALKIISQFESLDNAIKNFTEIKPARMGQSLHTNINLAILSKELSTIVTTVPINDISQPLTKNEILNDNFKKSLIKLEFKSLIQKYFQPSNLQLPTLTNSLSTINTINELDQLVRTILSKNYVDTSIAISIVTFIEETVGLSIAYKENEEISATFVPFNKELNKEHAIKSLTISSKIVSLDYKKLAKEIHNKNEFNVIFDTILAAYILNINGDISDIAKTILNIDIATDIELTGKGKNKRTFWQLTEDERKNYGASQSYVALATYPTMMSQISQNNQTKLYYDIELPLAKVLAHMEITGIRIDRISLVNFDNKISQDIHTLTQEIHNLADEEFNINSPSQMGTILFEKLNLKGSKKTKTGYSTAADVLEKIKNTHPIIQKILQYRMLTKLKSTYCEGLLNVTDPNTDKIHTTFNQTIASTGRISSIEPNLQNIPIRTEIGRSLRKVFIPTDETYVFLDADYSQIELRILAHLSKDENLINSYKTKQDIHRLTASQVLGIPLNEVTSMQRNNAKAINFGIIYGISGFSLSQDLNITKKEADEYINSYFMQYPNVKQYLDHSVSFAKENGYGITIFGRRRSIPELSSSNFIQRGFGERIAMNMPIQGSSADIIKIAMIKVHNRLAKENLKSRLILTVHDELLIEAKKEEKHIIKPIIKEEMENATQLLVPLEVEVHEGSNWYDAK